MSKYLQRRGSSSTNLARVTPEFGSVVSMINVFSKDIKALREGYSYTAL
jgi:hypothetical protein